MTRLRVGVIGCGVLAIRAICDLSRQLLAAVGDEYGLPSERRYTDYREMVESDVDAVIVCPSSSHAEPSIAATRAGKHVFVEKPMCTTEREAREMVAAADQAGVVLQVGYMKRHDPAYQFAKARLPEMPAVTFVQVNHLHCDNSLHLRDFRVVRFDDLPADARAAGQIAQRQRVAEALGVADLDQVEPIAQRAFGTILGSMIHDIGNLSGCFGPATRVVSTELWANGRGINTRIEYPHDRRAVCSWVDLPELWEFTETLELYGSRDRVRVSFPSGFARGMISTVNVHGMEADGRAWRKELVFHDNPFRLELLHFRQCVLEGKQPITPGREAVADIKLVADIVRAYLQGRP